MIQSFEINDMLNQLWIVHKAWVGQWSARKDMRFVDVCIAAPQTAYAPTSPVPPTTPAIIPMDFRCR